MATTQYIGARYVPIFVGEWDNNRTYEPLMVVTYQGASYTSKQYVPVGIEITNEKFWALTGNYNAQIEQYRKEVADYKNLADTTEEHLATIYPLDTTPTDDSAKGVTSDGIKKAIDTAEQTNATAISAETTRAKEAEQENTKLINTFIPASNPIYYGADPTGSKDSSAAINECISNNKTTVFSSGTYLINNPIVTDYRSTNRKSIDFNGATIICDFTDFALKIGFLNFTDSLAADGSQHNDLSYFKNGTIICNNANGCGIKVQSHYKGATIDNMTICANKYGIYCGGDIQDGKSYPCDTIINNCLVRADTRTDNFENSIGINMLDTDETISNTRVYYYDIGIKDLSGGKLSNLHILGSKTINWTDGIGIFIQGDGTLYENIYIDTYKTGIKAGINASHISLSNFFNYAWSNIDQHVVFDFSDTQDFEYIINNVNINISRQPQTKLLVPSRTVKWPLRGMGSSLTNVSFTGSFRVGNNLFNPDLEYLYVDNNNNSLTAGVNGMYITSILTSTKTMNTIEFITNSGNIFYLYVHVGNEDTPISISCVPIKAVDNEHILIDYEYNWDGIESKTCLIKLVSNSDSNVRFRFIDIHRNNSIVTRPFSIGYGLNGITQPTINTMGSVDYTFSV